jgi:hypothetical protein
MAATVATDRAAPAKPTWVLLARLREESGLTPQAIRKMAAEGLIRTRTLPHVHTRYALEDFRRLLAEAERGGNRAG